MSKVSVHQRKARDFIQREDWGNALVELERLLEGDGENPTLHNQVGDVYLRKDDVQRACGHFERAIDLYAEVGLHNNAVALCKKVMRLRPGRFEMRYRLARLRLDQGFRTEAAAFFKDYLDHVPPDDSYGEKLEANCREIVELLPEDAPVGKILEKLESAHRFLAAFEIVRKLAQRAADAGDDAAGRRYTEKLRSLRILVERSGGRDLLAEPMTAGSLGEPSLETPRDSHTTLPVAEPRVEPKRNTAPEPNVLAPDQIGAPGAALDLDVDLDSEIGIESGPLASQPSSVLNDMPVIDLDALPQMPDPVAAARFGAAGDDAEFMIDPEIVPGAELSTGDDFATRGAADLVTGAGTEFTTGGGEFALDTAAFATGDGVESPADSDLGTWTTGGPERAISPPGAPPHAKTSFWSEPRPLDAIAPVDPAEFELTETSFADLAQDLGGELPAGSPESDATSTRTPQVGWNESAAPAPRRPQPQAGSGWTENPELPIPGQSMTVSQTPRVVPPFAAPATEGGWIEELRRAPVWIPTGDTLQDPRADNSEGAHMELESVIDSFREQMARALDGDGAARYDLGVAYYDMGLYNEALAEFESAARCPGLEVQSYEMLAACLLQTGRHAEVIELVLPILAADGHSPRGRLGLQYSLGLAYEALGDWQQAQLCFEEVALVDIDFKDVQTRLHRA